MASLAGAESVVCVVRDSEWGSAEDVVGLVQSSGRTLGVMDRLEFVSEVSVSTAGACSLFTNLGFVRPLTAEVIGAMPEDAAISLMCEPWEVRASDVDLKAAVNRSVPVAGTNESHPLIRTFQYLGPLAGHLLFGAGIEVLGSSLLVVASEAFADPIRSWLLSAGATKVDLVIPPLSSKTPRVDQQNLDAVVVAHMGESSLDTSSLPALSPSLMAKSGTAMAVIAGDVDRRLYSEEGVVVCPATQREPGRMWALTSAIGPRPVVELHCGGLKVGEGLVRSRRLGQSAQEAVDHAVQSGFALRVDVP